MNGKIYIRKDDKKSFTSIVKSYPGSIRVINEKYDEELGSYMIKIDCDYMNDLFFIGQMFGQRLACIDLIKNKEI